MTPARLTRAEFRALIAHKPSRGYMVLRKRKRVKDAGLWLLMGKWRGAVAVAARGRCEKCGKKGQVGHHVFSKGQYGSVKYYPPNGIYLCNGCHLHAHLKRQAFDAWAQEVRGAAWWADLQDKAQTRHTRFTGHAEWTAANTRTAGEG